MPWTTDVPRLLAQFGVTLVAAPAIAWAGFQWFGKKWIEDHFAKERDKFKHAQNAEIEHLRFRINALMDRTSKLHQHEFEVIPQVWEKFTIVISMAVQFTAIVRGVPNLNAMGSEEFEAFLEKSPLQPWHKAEVRLAADKTVIFDSLNWRYDLHRVRQAYSDFHNYLVASGIFLQTDLKQQFYAGDRVIREAVEERSQWIEGLMAPGGAMPKRDELQARGPAIQAELEAMVHHRLWDANKLN